MVMSDGILKCWGDDYYGQLGIGNQDTDTAACGGSPCMIRPVVVPLSAGLPLTPQRHIGIPILPDTLSFANWPFFHSTSNCDFLITFILESSCMIPFPNDISSVRFLVFHSGANFFVKWMISPVFCPGGNFVFNPRFPSPGI